MLQSISITVLTLLLCFSPARGADADTAADADSRYEIQLDALIKAPDGATLSAVVVRPKGATERLPTLLTLSIYTDVQGTIGGCKPAVDRGYACVGADTRGKRLSPDPVVPYERDAEDAHAILDWITQQSWSNGSVGMRGGSYNGFTAWAAAKRRHPALKTIAVSAAAIPGFGLLTGVVNVTINKQDFDFGVTAFELMPDGTLFNLGYSLQRASYTKDPSRRRLLKPGQVTRIPFATTVVSRKLAAGSRLLVFFDANKNPGAQVNHGTGKDVSDESVADAGEPLRIQLRNDSFIEVPLSD